MTDSTEKKGPPYIAYVVRDYERGGQTEAEWMKVGVGWPHKSGNGFDIWLEAVPVSGRLVIRKYVPKSDAQTAQQ